MVAFIFCRLCALRNQKSLYCSSTQPHSAPLSSLSSQESITQDYLSGIQAGHGTGMCNNEYQ